LYICTENNEFFASDKLWDCEWNFPNKTETQKFGYFECEYRLLVLIKIILKIKRGLRIKKLFNQIKI